MPNNGWSDYQKLVLTQLTEARADIEELSTEVHQIHVELAALKVKASLWGGLAGLLPGIVAVLISIFK